MVRSAMVLAAGLGTRMRPLTDHRPKSLLHVGGRSMLDRTLDHLEGAGIARAVVNLHYLGQMIQAHLTGRSTPEIAFSDETEHLLETGGGVAHALPLLGAEPFVTINSDAIWHGANPVTALLDGWNPVKMKALLLFVPTERTVGYSRAGDFFLDGGSPMRRGARATAPYVYSGVQIIEPDAFCNAPRGPFSMNLIWDELLGKGLVRAVVYPGFWADVGTPEGLELANQLVRRAP